MMSSNLGASMAGVPQHPVSCATYTVDTMLNELSRQLVGNTRRYSRSSNGQQRGGNAMRICKPSSASNSPRSSAVQSRRRTLIGDGFQGRVQYGSPAVDQTYLPTPASATPSEPFHQREPRAARPLSWHPSSNYAQQSLFPHQDASATTSYSYSAYSDAETLANLHDLPSTPVAYSGYTSPAECFSPLLLPYSNFGSQPMCSPSSQPVPTPQLEQPRELQQQVAAYSPALGSEYAPTPSLPKQIPFLPPQAAESQPLVWGPYNTTASSLLNRPTAPPTPEDFAYGFSLGLGTSLEQRQQQQPRQQQPSQTGLKPETLMANPLQQQQQQHHQQELIRQLHPQQQPQQQQQQQQQSCYQPLIHDDDVDDDTAAQVQADESDGEILYGMGLYDTPDPTKAKAKAPAPLYHHHSIVFSLLGGTVRDAEDGDKPDMGRGLGLKLEDAWEPPVSEDEEDEEDGAGDDGGDGDGEEEQEE